MEANSADDRQSRRRRSARQQMIEKKKARDELIRAANSLEDPLASFGSSFCYHRNGLSVHFRSGCGDNLSGTLKHSICKLLKLNMEGHYGLEWHTEERVKYREMISPEARYIFAFDSANADINKENILSPTKESGDIIVGFAHYRFTLEEEVPVVYVYELQLQSYVRGKGLGEFMMQLLELIARKNCMGAVVLTVQKSNLSAMKFYTNKLRYTISSISPSRVDPLIAAEKNYEILCKAFDRESQAKLE